MEAPVVKPVMVEPGMVKSRMVNPGMVEPAMEPAGESSGGVGWDGQREG
jgi:hypothetical protein